MFTEYALNIINDHLVINDEQRLLIDTGSPLSFHTSGLLKLCGEDIPVRTSIPQVTSTYLSEKVGVQIDGLLGMDIISQYPMLVDVKNKFIFLDDDAEYVTQCNGMEPNTFIGNFVGISALVNNRMAKMIVDTGAHISYIHPSFVDGLSVERTVDDYSPYIGDFQTNTYMCDVDLQIKGFIYKQTFGTLPEMMQSAISFLGADGVIGIDLFKKYRLQIKNGHLFFPPQGI